MSLTPSMERDNYTKMLQSLKAYKEVGGLLKMSAKQLENMPKEVLIALAPNEIALVWDRLPNHMKNDSEMLKYQFCYEHSRSSDSESSSNTDVNDGPLTRRLFCCYCKISDVTISAENSIQTRMDGKNKGIGLLNPLSCCSSSSKSQ